jgi:hypothetical protein
MRSMHCPGPWLSLALFITALLVGVPIAGCGDATPRTEHAVAQQTAFRVRADVDADLNADAGWAGAVGENVAVHVEQPFRLRVEVEHILPVDTSRRFRLQVQHNGGAWTNVPAADFPYPSEATPRVSIVSTDAYADGAATADVLDGSRVPFRAGTGVNLADAARPLPADTAVHSEWAWPLVIRRFADGAVTTDEGDTFSFRMTDAEGRPVASDAYPTVTASVPPRLLGGTFVETPGRIGPWEASNGDLYFLMEPAETYNVLMAVKSVDGGATWHEVDGANRPATGDLEGFASDQHGNTIHMLHQTDEAVLHHAFRTSDHPTAPDTWVVRDDTVATPGEPPVQVATLTARSDGSLVGVYGGPEKIHVATRSPGGTWHEDPVVDPGSSSLLSGPQTVLGERDVVHLAYTSRDGAAWYRRIRPDGTLTPRVQIASDLGTTEADGGSVLPLVFLPAPNTVVVIYRRTDGTLWARRIVDHRPPTDPVRVSERAVVQNAVDSDQVGADAIAADETVHVLFIEDGTGHIYHTQRGAAGAWQGATLQVDSVNAQWIRGQPLTRGGDTANAYGFVYDAGSNGGSGMNRYAEVPLRR